MSGIGQQTNYKRYNNGKYVICGKKADRHGRRDGFELFFAGVLRF
jgi:hypothetical protein